VTIIESPTASYQLRSISYTVPSATEAGVSYTVMITDDAITCTCLAGHYKRPCWHRKAVKAGQVTSKPRVRIRPLEATVVSASAPSPDVNPSAWLWDPDA